MRILKDKKNRKLRIFSFIVLSVLAVIFLAPYF